MRWRGRGPIRRFLLLKKRSSEIANVAKLAMPRGSKLGERRGGRQRGTPNKATVAKAAALKKASSDPSVTPLEFLLGIMRDSDAPTDLRVKVAAVAARLANEKLTVSSQQQQTDNQGGLGIDITEAKLLRDVGRRLASLLQKQFGPSENGGPLTDVERRELDELQIRYNRLAERIPRPADYGRGDAWRDSNRLHQLLCKRLTPPAAGGGELKGAEDDEEAILTSRVAAFWASSEGRDLKRIQELQWRRFLTEEQQRELDELLEKHPEARRNRNSFVNSSRRASQHHKV
jgi:hypothetical protein